MPKVTYQDREGFAPPVPAGDYILGIESANLEISKGSGNEQVKLICRVMWLDDKKKLVHGPIVYDYLIFSEKAEWKFDVVLKSTGRQPKKGDVVDVTEDWLKDTLVGAMGWATLNKEEYQGKENNKIVRWLTSGKPNPYDIVETKTDSKEENF